MLRLTFSQRIKVTFFAGFILFSLIALLAVFATNKSIEDHIFERVLLSKVALYEGLVSESKPRVIDDTHETLESNFHRYTLIRRYLPNDPLPHALNELFTGWQSWPEQVGELDHPDDKDFHFAIRYIHEQPTLFIYDVNDLELSEEIETLLLNFILFFFLALSLGYFLFFQLVLKRSLQPMFNLIKRVKQHSEQPDKPFPEHHYPADDELGLLNKTIADYAEKNASLITREREFSQFASHELRTPVTVIKGATELLSLQDNPKVVKPIERISRATKQMEDMINVLLALARIETRSIQKTGLLQDSIDRTVELISNEMTNNGKELVVSGSLMSLTTDAVSEFELVLTNLLSNAIKHSAEHWIKLEIEGSSLTISNSTPADYQQGESGFGLKIVERVCLKQNWKLSFNQHNTIFEVVLILS